MEHLDHPSSNFNDAKMARCCSFAPSSLLSFFWGGGGRGGELLFHFILSKIASSSPKTEDTNLVYHYYPTASCAMITLFRLHG